MKKIILGEKFKNKKYDFRETCFGIYEKDGKILLVNKEGQYSLIGGGINENETKHQCIKREFTEESGYKIKNIKKLCTIDCFWLARGKWPMESLANIFIVDVDTENISVPSEKDHYPEFVDIKKAINILPLPYHKKALEIYIEK